MYLLVKESHGEQYSGGDRRELFLRTAVISDLRSVRSSVFLWSYTESCACGNEKRCIPAVADLRSLFGLTSHLVYTGYVVLGFWWLLATRLCTVIQKEKEFSGR